MLETKGLSLWFASFCIIDLFGILPVIALPRVIIECGWFGIPLAFGVFLTQIYTAVLLGRCWILSESLMGSEVLSRSRNPYTTMVKFAFGPSSGTYVNWLLAAAVFGGTVPNLIIASQNLELIGLRLSSNTVDFSYCYWTMILGVGLTPFMWLESPKDLKYVALASVIVVLTSSALTWFCLLLGNTVDDPRIPTPTWESVILAYGILAFQFDVHPMILTVQMDMRHKNELGFAILFAFLVTGSLFFITSLLCYVGYGSSIGYNTLESLPPSFTLYLDFFIVTLQIILSTVVGASPLFQQIEDLFHIKSGLSWRRCFVRSFIMICVISVGETIPRFDLIMGLVGGGIIGQLMFIFPPLLYAKLKTRRWEMETASCSDYGTIAEILRPLKSRVMTASTLSHPPTSIFTKFFDLNSVLDNPSPITSTEKVLHFTLIVLGVAATVFSTYYGLIVTILYAEFAPPCISNASFASVFLYRN